MLINLRPVEEPKKIENTRELADYILDKASGTEDMTEPPYFTVFFEVSDFSNPARTSHKGPKLQGFGFFLVLPRKNYQQTLRKNQRICSR